LVKLPSGRWRRTDDADAVVGFKKPATALSSVDFPQPHGPTIETNSPGLTWIWMSVTAWTALSTLS
jgi:hypothetical protein